jgi:cytoskeleton protein RodZ
LALKKSSEPVNEALRGLRFVFNGDSWVEVRDADGKVVFSRTNAAGTERRVQGDPPFNVVVGGASNVQLTYNGTAVDLAAYPPKTWRGCGSSDRNAPCSALLAASNLP